jgi:hypothetical protein
MAPEQLEGREVTAQSDIYALGLVLYEMFTGKAAFQADTAAEMLRKRQESRLTNPSAVISDLDPALERAILRCLDPDPKRRPASALDLARSLPGGDPLAAALAAGETPSPDMVAASGSTEALRPAVAVSLLAAVAVLLVAMCLVRPPQVMLNQIPLENPPEVLAAKAREIARNLGYADRPVDFASGFTNETAYRDFMGKSTHGFEAWNRTLAMPPSPVTFWYRQSPGAIVSTSETGVVGLEDPFPSVPGMVGMILDSDGRLREFTAVPPQLESSGGPSTAPDWSTLFAAARLDMGHFKTAEPQWTPLAATDMRAAWTGVYPGRADLPIRVEAAAFRGRAVYFQIVWPWTTPERVPAAGSAADLIAAFLLVAVTAAAVALARHNWKAGRGDLRGATRLALFNIPLLLLRWLLGAHHLGPGEGGLVVFFRGLELAVFVAASTWVTYLALEPWVRRHWPQALVVWSRVLAGRWRDPVVGRDMLCGTLGGLALLLFTGVYRYVLIRLGDASAVAPNAGHLISVRLVAADAVNGIGAALGLGLTAFLALFLLRVLLRNQWLAAAAVTLILALLASAGSVHWIPLFAVLVVVFGSMVVAGMRFGLFAALAGFYVVLLTAWLDTTSFTAWYGQGSLAAVILIGALALWGFRVSLGGQQVFTGAALEK